MIKKCRGPLVGMVFLLATVALSGLAALAQAEAQPKALGGGAWQIDNFTGAAVIGILLRFDRPVTLDPGSVLAFGGSEVKDLEVSGRSVWIRVDVVRRGTLFVSLGKEDGIARVRKAYWARSGEERNGLMVRCLVEEFWNQGDEESLAELALADYILHTPSSSVPVPFDGVRMVRQGYVTAFPDLKITPEAVIAEGDTVVVRNTITGTHSGPLMGISPTGLPVTFTDICFHRLVNGKIAETWQSYDLLGIFQQIGVLPPMGRRDYTWGAPSDVTGQPGNPEMNQELIEYLVEQAWNSGNLGVIDDVVASDYVLHDPVFPMPIRGSEGFKEYVFAMNSPFPDAHITVEAIVAQGDMVAVRWTRTGTQEREMMGIPATGKAVSLPGLAIHRLADGKLVESWFCYDMFGLLQQLGVIPPLQ